MDKCVSMPTGQEASAQARVSSECISWRWNGNLGDDLIFAAQEGMFGEVLDLGQYVPDPAVLLIGGGTFVPKALHHPDVVALSERLPTAFFGTGIGDPEIWGRDHIPAWLEVMKNAAFIGVRGPLSVERLRDWGVPADRLEWVGDPALYFAQTRTLPRKEFSGKLAVNLGETYGQLYGNSDAAVERAVTQALERLALWGWDITLISVWGPDDAVLERIAETVPVAGIEHWHDDYAKSLASVGEFDLMLCEKLHAGVVAACRNVPFLALNYRSKVLDFCRSVHWEEFCLSTDGLDPYDIVERLSVLQTARELYVERLQQSVAAVRERLLSGAARLLSAVLEPRA
jgi:polysaccharide pyruvyl transferase WcaK-like protein